MKSEFRLISPSLKLSITIGIFLFLLIIFLTLTFKTEFSVILLSIGGTIGLMGILFTIGKVAQLVFAIKTSNVELESKKVELDTKKQNLRLVTYQADRAALESNVLHFSKNERLIVPNDAPIKLIEAMPELANNQQLLLPANTQELDLLTVFTQATQSYAIIGGQQTGKTFQAQHIAAFWLSKGYRPVIVGPKWDKDEWTGCHLFGGKGNFSEVAKGIEIVRQEAGNRHADITKSHKAHSILPVFFDDWTPIVDSVENARELVLQATTLYASVNIILYFILHSDTANAWGVDKKGAALKDNFIKLLIIPSYDTNGLIVREKTKGVIKFPGDNVEYPVKLFSYPVNFFPADNSIFEQDNLLCEVIPAESKDDRIIELYREGNTLTGICTQLYGYKNQARLEQIKQVLTDNGLIG